MYNIYPFDLVPNSKPTNIMSNTDQKMDQKMAVMEANNLTYKFDDVLNVSTNRTAKKQYFDTRTYTMPGAGQAVSTWNSGVDLIDFKNSYLTFTVRFDDSTATNNGQAYYGVGSAMNFLNEVRGVSSSGVEMFRTQDANVFHAKHVLPQHTAEWRSSVGSLMGVDTALNSIDLDSATTYTYCIPLCELDPFFNLYYQKLSPANVCSGMRIELTFENLNTVIFKSAAGAVATSYYISNIEFRTESITLADSANAIINKQAATDGIEITYDRVYSTSKTTILTDEIIEIRKGVSLAKSAMGCLLTTANRTSQILDSFVSIAFDITSFDFRLGDQFYPWQPILGSAAHFQEAYFNYLKYYNKLKSSSPSAVSYATFVASAGQLGAKFETDDSLNLSGIPVSSSRTVELRFTRTANTSVKAYVFLVYTALCRASLSNVSIKI